MKSKRALYFAQLGLLAAAYLAAALLGPALQTRHGSIWLLWPAAGVALGGLLRFGTHLWPAVTAASFVYSAGVAGVRTEAALGLAAGNTLQALAGCYVLRRAGLRNELDRLRDVVVLAAVGAFLAPALTVLLGNFGLYLAGSLPWEHFLDRAAPRWCQNALGILLVAPALLTWTTGPRPGGDRATLLPAAGLFLLLTAVTFAAFALAFPNGGVSPLTFAVFPLLIAAALRFGPRGAAAGVLPLTAVTAGFTVYYAPLVATAQFREDLVELQAFLAVASVTALALAASAAERKRAEESRLRSEFRFRLVWEKSVDSMRLLDADGTVLQVNAAFCRMVGMDEGQLLGRPFTDILAPEERPAVRERYLTTLGTGVVETHLEQEVVLWSGQRLWVEVSNSLVQPPGEPPLVLSVFRNVTERKRTEDALRHSVERYRSLFDANPHPMWVFDEETLAFLAVNDAAVAHYGYTREEFLAMRVVDIRPTEEVPRLLNFLGNPNANKQKAGVWRHRKKDGALVDMEIESHDLPFGGRPARVVLAYDVTERLHTEEVVRSSEAKYRSLVENLEQSIFLKDRELCFVAANRRFCQSVGRTEAELIGRTDYEIYPRRLAERYRADDFKVLEEGRRVESEEQTLIAGNPRKIRVVKTPVKDDQGQAVGVLGIFWDVTDQRNLEEQLRQAQKMEAVGQLAGGVAHDFNNLLTVVLGNLSLVLSQWPPREDAPQMLQAARTAGLRAAELTRQLLGFSRRTVLRPQALNLNTAIEETAAMLRRTIDPRISLETVAGDNLGTVHADPGQMNQVLMNLCLNARDAMPDGGRLILESANVELDEDHARLTVDAKPGAYVRLRVRDTGHGIPPEIRSRIFDPFFTTKELGKGTGLGLAMVFGIVKQHKGWIECFSEVGRGTRFDIYLPQSTAAPAEPTVLAPGPRRGSETILLVDDEAMIRQLGGEILRQHGYRVLLAENGLQALLIYKREMPHVALVILDLSMPQLSGRDTLKHLRQIDPNVRVLFSSGFSADQVTETEADGVFGFLSKPYTAGDMAEQVRNVLDRRRPGGNGQPVGPAAAAARG